MESNRICIFDIDGVLNDYPNCYVKFINAKLGTHFENLTQAKDCIPYSKYCMIKELYRISGYKEQLEVREEAYDLLQELKSLGFYIIILSSRPVNKHNSLIAQTTNWLKKNCLEYDYLIFGKDKHLDVIQKFGDVEFVVEDNRNYANSIAKHGYKVFLVNNQYNQGELEELVFRVKSIEEILEEI